MVCDSRINGVRLLITFISCIKNLYLMDPIGGQPGVNKKGPIFKSEPMETNAAHRNSPLEALRGPLAAVFES